MKSLVLYDSFTGNTEKVVDRICKVLEERGVGIERIKVKKGFDETVEMHDYDLVFIGSPVIQFLPSVNLMEFCKKHLHHYLKKGVIVPKSPKIPGKYGVPFVSFGGMHTGIREAIPALKYLEQFLEHLRFEIVDEFYVVGEYKSPEFRDFNKETVLGDITGRPNEEDLRAVEDRVRKVLDKIERKEKTAKREIYTPAIVTFLEKHYPSLKDKMFEFVEERDRVKSLTDKELVLVMIGLAACMRCKECLKRHITAALEMGVTPEEIRDIFASGFLVCGASFTNFGVEVLKELGLF